MKQKKKDTTDKPKASKTAEAQLKELREKFAELEKQRDELEKQRDELLDKLQRLSADYANFQKRVPKQIADNLAYNKERIIKSLLPVIDNFEHTLAHSNSTDDADALLKGVRIIYDQMLDVLKSHEVEQIQALGKKFDPAFHEAMMQRCEPDRQAETVLEEFQKGYTLAGRVIRPSKVIVNTARPQQESETPRDAVVQADPAMDQDNNKNNKTNDNDAASTE